MKNNKIVLLIQSLSPIFLLSIIKNLPIDYWITKKEEPYLSVYNRVIFYVVLIICILWIVISIFTFLGLKYKESTSTGNSYHIKSIKKDTKSSIEFFITFLFPLIVDDLFKIQNVLFFISLITLLIILLWNTTLFYKNPVLNFLGYKIYDFSLEDSISGIGISLKEITTNDKVVYTPIADGIYFLRKIKKVEGIE